MTPAQALLSKVDRVDTQPASIKRLSAEKALSDFEDHLDWLLVRHVKKPHNDLYRAQMCFRRLTTFRTTAEFTNFLRTNLEVAVPHFKQLANEIRRVKGKTHANLMANSRGVTDYIFDLKGICEPLEQKKNPSYEFLTGGKSYHTHSFRLFLASRGLAYGSKLFDSKINLESRVAQVLSVFALRQAMELKFRRLVGVEIRNQKNATPRLRHDFHYEFIVNHPHFYKFVAVKFDVLKIIYEWANEVVHQAYVPDIWQLDYAHSICDGLFRPQEVKPGKAWSIYNAVEIRQLDQLRQEFAAEFYAEYRHGFWGMYWEDPEAVVK
ncbi:MAG: hypothetical protein OXH94_04945 [Rhodospirillales bacterium]|nr:hypothetical protein [Rhodospirillales bacterium]